MNKNHLIFLNLLFSDTGFGDIYDDVIEEIAVGRSMHEDDSINDDTENNL